MKQKEEIGGSPTIKEFIKAGYPCLFMPTVEPEVAKSRVQKALVDLGMESIPFGMWKVTTGLIVGRADGTVPPVERAKDLLDALALIEVSKEPIVSIFYNVRQFVAHHQIIQQLLDSVMAARLRGSHIILVGPHIELPSELKNLVTYVDCPLPTRDAILEEYKKLTTAYSADIELPSDKEEREDLLRAAATAAVGLDMMGAENALALSLATCGSVNIKVIQAQKEQEVKKSDVLEFISSDETMDDVGGFKALKEWFNKRRRVFTDEAREYGLPYPKGVLIVGPAGCLAGDTVLPFRRGNKNSGRLLTVREAYYKFNQIPRAGKGRGGFKSGARYLWSPEIPTQTLSMLDDGFIGYHEIEDIVYSGVKEIYEVEVESGRTIRVTHEHPFLKSNGDFSPLAALEVGQSVMLRDMRAGTGRSLKPYEDRRRVVHSVPFHPHAWDHWVSVSSTEPWKQANYKRIHFARLVVEADMNKMSVDSLISVVRSKPREAAALRYLGSDVVVHHLDGNELNDSRENLQVLTKAEHDLLSNQNSRSRLRFSTAVEECITRIERIGEEDTFDIVMREPHRNYVAHGFVVHNTGKSLTAKAIASYLRLPLLRLDMGKIFRSLVGESESAIRMALQVAEAVSPVVLWMDEIDKGLAGMKGSGELDSGVTSRVISTILTWRQETKSPVILAATANEVQSIPSMVYRKGRLDEVWATDLPFEEEREEIFAIHLRKRKRDPAKYNVAQLAAQSPEFTGSEIEGCLEDAMFAAFDRGEEVSTSHILRALKETIPQARRDAEEVASVRAWVETRARLVSGGESERKPTDQTNVRQLKMTKKTKEKEK